MTAASVSNPPRHALRGAGHGNVKLDQWHVSLFTRSGGGPASARGPSISREWGGLCSGRVGMPSVADVAYRGDLHLLACARAAVLPISIDLWGVG